MFPVTRNLRASLVPSLLAVFSCCAIIWIASMRPAYPQCVAMNLDGQNTCPEAESQVELILTNPAAPVGYCNMVTNGVVGQAFTFEWPTAGPGGLAGWTGVGTVSGSGYVWEWETVSQVHQLACGGVGIPCMSFADTNTQVQSGPFTVPMQWEAGAAEFRAAIELDPEDGPSSTFVRRCIAYAADPPPAGWDGVHIMKTK